MPLIAGRLKRITKLNNVHETVAMLDAILNFLQCSGVTEVHLADSEKGRHGLPNQNHQQKAYRYTDSNPMVHLPLLSVGLNR